MKFGLILRMTARTLLCFGHIMTFRIEYIPKSSGTAVRLSGRLSGNAVVPLKKVCDSIEKPFEMDLSHLLYADEEGVRVIRTFVKKGVRIHGASPFIMLLLNNTSGLRKSV